MPKQQHVHKYERQEIGKKGWVIYRCMLPDCSHFLPSEIMILGRLSLCWGSCGEAVVYDQYMLSKEIKHPKCDKCIEEKKERLEVLSRI